MGGFANLKKDFDQLIVMVRPDRYTKDLSKTDALEIDMTYRYLMLRCLFEIAGNLDTIAVEMREIRKDLKARHFMNEIQEFEMMNPSKETEKRYKK